MQDRKRSGIAKKSNCPEG